MPRPLSRIARLANTLVPAPSPDALVPVAELSRGELRVAQHSLADVGLDPVVSQLTSAVGTCVVGTDVLDVPGVAALVGLGRRRRVVDVRGAGARPRRRPRVPPGLGGVGHVRHLSSSDGSISRHRPGYCLGCC